MLTIGDNHFIGLEDIKNLLGIDDTSKDNVLIQLINATSQWLINAIGRDIMKNEYLEKKKGFNKQKMTVKYYPVREIKRIYNIATGVDLVPADLINRSTNKFELEKGIIYLDSGFKAAGYNYGLEPDMYPISRYIGISYVAGYVFPSQATDDEPCDLPADLVQVVIDKIKYDFYQSEMGIDGLSSFSISDVSWGFKEAPTEEWLKVIGGYTEAF